MQRSPDSKRGLAVALLAAAACRLGVFFALPSVFDFARSGAVHGSEAFDVYARNLLATGVWGYSAGTPDAAIPPGYGLVLAGIFGAFGRNPLAVAAVQTAFDLVSIALLASLGAALFRRRAVGVLAAFLAAGYPYLVFQTLVVNDTALFILEVVAFLALALRLRDEAIRRRSVALGVAAGLVLGFGTLTRPAMLLVGVAAAAWLLVHVSLREAARRLVPPVFAAGLVLGLWAARNERVYGRFVPIATNGGSNFWQGNNARTLAFLTAGYDVQWIPPGALGGVDFRDPASNGVFLRAGLAFLRDHPGEIPKLAWRKAAVQWSLDVSPRRNPSSAAPSELDVEPGAAVDAYSSRLFDVVGRTVHATFWGTALALALVGLVATRRAWREVSLAWAVPASLTVFYVVFHPSTRYRLPGDLEVFLFSAAGALALWDAARRAPRAAGRDVPDVHDRGLQE